MKTAILRRCEKNLAKTIDNLLTESAAGVRRLTPAELKNLSDVLRAEQPPLFFIQTVLVNQFSFLTLFPAEPAERAAVERFLTAFQQQAAADLLARHDTLTDGITLQVMP